MDELRKLLENVSDSYKDFVDGLCSLAKEYDEIDILIDYIKENPEANSSEIIHFMMSGGIKEIEYEEDEDEKEE